MAKKKKKREEGEEPTSNRLLGFNLNKSRRDLQVWECGDKEVVYTIFLA